MSIEERIKNILKNQFNPIEESKITPSAQIIHDLGADSLDYVEIIMATEEEFSIEIPDHECDNIHTVGQLVEFVKGQVN